MYRKKLQRVDGKKSAREKKKYPKNGVCICENRTKQTAVHLWVDRRGTSTAAAAAAEEQENDEDDPDPVVVVEDVAQTVVHSVPPKMK